MGDPRPEDKVEITALINGLFGAYADLDAQQLGQNKVSDYMVYDLFMPQLFSEQEDIEQFRRDDVARAAKRGPLEIGITEPIIRRWDDTAVACYYLDYDFTEAAIAGRARCSDTFVRQDDRWVHAHHNEGALPAGPPD
jgi:hypothetical protein